MENNSVDSELRKILRESEPEIPTTIQKRIDQTLTKLPTAKKKNKFLKRFLITSSVTVASFALLIAISISSPSITNALKQVPVIEYVFQLLENKGLNKANEMGLISNIDQNATDENITVSIIEVFNDGINISVGYAIHFSDKLNSSNIFPDFKIKLDGKSPSSVSVDTSSGQWINDLTYINMFTINTDQPSSEQFQFDLIIEQIGETKGNWSFSFPLTKEKSETTTILPMLTITEGETTIIIEEVNFTLTSTKIRAQMLKPGVLYDTYDDFEVIDDQGESLRRHNSGVSFGNDENIVQWEAEYEAVQEVPAFLTVWFREGLEITIPIE
ncbi:DUF4179 domain-containing protein [Chengkuizengella axinellae]|uniref:DUF4179 domain-containing protein n=1 Tax=Chengkuizengella axinellae TaxID=3064388 RepID=A0ABT9J625_9BACL|nr:DUF4179 domain-containing protein [Chengkuizengella sp. 2205SS18-9]MDP5276404.1 DUF4179 domain-containing protein [Chengkuizengella sp. 2205SS18-9]